MNNLVRSFGFSLAVSILVFAYVLITMGPGAGLVTLILAAIELAFSFDNAVINAKILAHVGRLWRDLFLSVGIIIAIFGVRAFLPLVIVGLSAHLPIGAVADLAINQPMKYAHELEHARPAITAFGGAFLLMLSLHFFIAIREVHWLKAIERPLSRYVRWWLPLVVTAAVVGVLALLPANQHREVELIAGFVGLATYGLINGAIALMNRAFQGSGSRVGERMGWAAFATFLYLEVLDASLSFDGVIGAFAITNEVVLIAAGLGIGAIWVRSLTVYMVRNRTLDAYRYLEHGAHYAILVLAVTMLLAVMVEVPDFVTGVLCLGLIAAALITSRQAIEQSAVKV